MIITGKLETVRLYYNSSTDYKKCCSIDFGEGTPEICCGYVKVLAFCYSVFNMSQQPHFCLTFFNVYLEINEWNNDVEIRNSPREEARSDQGAETKQVSTRPSVPLGPDSQGQTEPRAEHELGGI